ncbi:hypothetical protein GLW08_02700 [Pontibacillus yanchengensis]|uniref:Uncharacterized protein n=2 Tax=Pontibacillus yanchengensis TaxID=462910 RepID=A0A6I5A3T8_9BACI|nr:hypothetical protein [Pontibacillus yanchengensis]MYL34771.1 hypothetical protein [Pontibacillus yanchengensis]MYL52243.1 hypothetical protein [Pontibacillus yanchengensis]
MQDQLFIFSIVIKRRSHKERMQSIIRTECITKQIQSQRDRNLFIK